MVRNACNPATGEEKVEESRSQQQKHLRTLFDISQTPFLCSNGCGRRLSIRHKLKYLEECRRLPRDRAG
jgi:hypothetical protein